MLPQGRMTPRLTEVLVEGDAAIRVVNRRQQLTDPLWSLSFVETLPVPTLRQDVQAVGPEDGKEITTTTAKRQ